MNVRTLQPGIYTALWLLPIVALLQSTVARHLGIAGAFPGIMLIVVVNWGILRGMDEGMLWAFLGGVCVDLFSGWPFGTSTVALVLVASVVSLGEGTFIRTHALLPLATVFGATVLYYLVVLFILESTQHPVDWLTDIRDMAIPAAVYNAIANIAAFPMVRKLEDRVYPLPRAKW